MKDLVREKSKVLFVMDDINYKGGGHFATFAIANHLVEAGYAVTIFSPIHASMDARERISKRVRIVERTDYHGYDFIVAAFENSKFREEISQVRDTVKIQWIHIDYEKWMKLTEMDTDREYRLFSAFDRIVFVSEQNKKGFLKVFPCFEEKCRVVYNFLDSEGIREKSQARIDHDIFLKKDPEQLNVVVLGRLEPQKGYHRLLDVAKLLKRKGLLIEWFVLGEGYEYDELRERQLRHNLDNVHFMGFRKNPFPFIREADIFALLSEYEGLALVAAESFCVGTPVLTTETGGIREVFDEKYGWIVENNIYSILDQIEKIYADRDQIESKRKLLKNYGYKNPQIRESLNQLFGEDIHKTHNAEQLLVDVAVKRNQSEENIEISVIVPVYNMEMYLQECLDSLVCQTFSKLEIIIVNDGSTDKSQQIIEDYVYRYPDKIRAYKTENHGLGEARNYGMRKARGKYFGFVDSDDTIRPDMYEILYRAAVQNAADCVICDYIAMWDTGKTEYVTSVAMPYPDRFDILRYSTKFGVVNAVTKLVDRTLFQYVTFTKGFYEDLATMPIILSYANKLHYVREGLYNYRQRNNSITSIKSNDKRTLDCYKAWDRIQGKANPVFCEEIFFAIYWSMNFFCTNFLDTFTYYSNSYYQKNKTVFIGNAMIEKGIKEGEILNFDTLPVIPKIIHYCWFGNNPPNALIRSCMESWKKFAPDFEIIEWNERNCDMHENSYVEKAYEEKKYAFVSDYFRLKALEEFGGVYLDTDMELIKPLEVYLYSESFFAFETPLFVHAGIIGAVPHNSLIHDILKTYQNENFEICDNGMPKPIPRRITEILKSKSNLIQNGKTQILNGNTKIYSANIMTMNFHDGNCVANHHYEGSWKEKTGEISSNYGYEVMKHYFTWDLLHTQKLKLSNTPTTSLPTQTSVPISDLIFQRDFYKSEFERLEHSTCWKITKPLRIVADFLKKLIGKK